MSSFVQRQHRRWLVLIGCIAVNLVSGAPYATSILKKKIMGFWGITNEQWALVFSMMLILWPIGMLLSAGWMDKGAARVLVVCGGILIGLGFWLAGSTKSVPLLYPSFALASLGIGFSYGAAVALSVKWFPERRGLASGLTVGALGFGTAIIAAVGQWLVESKGIDVASLLRLFGIAFFLLLIAASVVIASPPVQLSSSASNARGADLPWNKMVLRGRFWLLYLLYVCGTFSGLMVISQTAPIAREMGGMSAAAAAGVVSAMGLANAAGRVLWGAASDKLGRFTVLVLLFAVTAFSMVNLHRFADTPAALVPALVILALCFGGFLGTFPSICADSFGAKNAAVNYALLFTAFGVSGVLGPKVGAMFGATPAAFTRAFQVAAGVAGVGLVFALATQLAEIRTRRTALQISQLESSEA
ncbi:MAG: OFA family MFS transporter [Armatimonadota bacterium]|nr:OFA family MFS transporter [Armatimonadota bacterium]